MNKKICTQCEKELPASTEFFHRSNGKFGFSSWCKECTADYKSSNRERFNTYSLEYYYNNKEKKAKSSKRYYEKNKDKIKDQRSSFKAKTMRKKWNKKYYEKTKVVRNISRSMLRSLGSNKSGSSWETLVNYTLDELKTHLESIWKDGMSWENYGRFGWHIDHVRPINAFDSKKLKDINSKEFEECWSLNNLQPLWWKDNLVKGSKENEYSF